jgi:hypothetical protein
VPAQWSKTNSHSEQDKPSSLNPTTLTPMRCISLSQQHHHESSTTPSNSRGDDKSDNSKGEPSHENIRRLKAALVEEMMLRLDLERQIEQRECEMKNLYFQLDKAVCYGMVRWAFLPLTSKQRHWSFTSQSADALDLAFHESWRRDPASFPYFNPSDQFIRYSSKLEISVHPRSIMS